MAKARFLHISDVHLGAFPEEPVRRADVGAAFERALALAIDEKVDFVVIAGDLFDKKTISPDILDAHARRPLERLRDAGIPVFAIEGNHDEPVHGARHSWVSYLGVERLLVPLRPVLQPALALPEQPGEQGIAARVRAPGGVDIVGLGYLGPRTESVLADLPRVLPELGSDAARPAVVLLHAMPSPTGLADPGTFTEAALEPLASRHVYLALGHGHRRYLAPVEAHERPCSFVAASPGSLEYIHETDFHRDDPRGAWLVTVREDGRFEVEARDTLKRPRFAVRVPLDALAAPNDLTEVAVARCRDVGLAPGAIVGIVLEGEPPFSRAQLPLPALERRVRETFRPVSLDVRFAEDAAAAAGAAPGEGPDLDADPNADVASTLGQLFKERLPAGVPLPQIERLAAFVAGRLGEGGAWLSSEDRSSDLPDTLACLVGLVAGEDASWVLEAALAAEARHAAPLESPSSTPAPATPSPVGA